MHGILQFDQLGTANSTCRPILTNLAVSISDQALPSQLVLVFSFAWIWCWLSLNLSYQKPPARL